MISDKRNQAGQDVPDFRSTVSSGPAPAAARRRSNAYAVHHSPIHGRGVFATRDIAAETRLLEYKGERISAELAIERSGTDPDNPYHTFFFSLDDGRLIDGAVDGNAARWINHACEPNCEAREQKGRIFIYALRDISPGEELNYDYCLTVEGRHTAKLKQAYRCLCGAQTCRSTMLAPKR